MSQYALHCCRLPSLSPSLRHNFSLPLSSLIPPQAFPSTPSSCLALGLGLLLPALPGPAVVGPSCWVGPHQDPTPWGCNTKFHAGGLRCRPQGGAHGEPWLWNKTREDFFSSPALESACEQDDLFLQRSITWQKLDRGLLQASSTFLTHKPKSCPISSPFSKAWGHEEKVTKFLEAWSCGERVYFLPVKWSAAT